MLKYISQPIFYKIMEILKQKKVPGNNPISGQTPYNSYYFSKQNSFLSFDLGLISYNHAYDIQIEIFEMVKSKGSPGVILLLEHYPVVTIGSNKSLKNLLVTKEKLRRQNIELVQSNRGGDITLHIPGQIVCYPIINLAVLEKDISLFVHNLEQVIIDVLKNFEIEAARINKHRGIFVDNFKIASIGLKVKKWITMHGFSLNVNNDLKYFDNITACGLRDYPQTSMEKILKKSVDICRVKEQIIVSFSGVFNMPVKKMGKLF